MIKPPEPVPVAEYIRDEIDARCWSIKHLAARMGGNMRDNLRLLKLLAHNIGKEPELTFPMAAVAPLLARAFGTEPEVWVNLHNARLEWLNS